MNRSSIRIIQRVKNSNDPDSVKIRLNEKNEVECIFIQTKFMKKWFIDFHEVHHIDTTFKVYIFQF